MIKIADKKMKVVFFKQVIFLSLSLSFDISRKMEEQFLKGGGGVHREISVNTVMCLVRPIFL